MNLTTSRPGEPTFAELIALKMELSKARKRTKELRARLTALGVPESELPEFTDVQSAYAAIGAELIRRCPCAAVCAKAFRAGKAVQK